MSASVSGISCYSATNHRDWLRYPVETTSLFQQLVYRALGEGIISESKAAELLLMPIMKFHQARKLEFQYAVAG